MGAYFTPIMMAVIILIFIGFFTALPWTIHTYRKYGYFSFWTTFVIFSFVFYALAAYFLVILPLPEVQDTCAIQAADMKHYQLVPFYFLYEIIQASNIVWTKAATYINIIRHPSFLPAFFNLLILLPLGVYMRYFKGNKLKIRHMFIIGFSVSLFFELTQLTALYGIYTCPYRMFNVDDLILNTFGAVIGFMIAPLILALFPTQKEIMEKSKRVFQEGYVPPIAQLIALLVDYIAVMISWTIFSMILKLDEPIIHLLFMVLGLFILQFIIPLMTRGSTLGSMLLRFELRHDSNKKSQTWSLALVKRCLALILPWTTFQVLSLVNKFAKPAFDDAYYALHIWIQVSMILLMFLIVFVLFIHVLFVILKKNVHHFYFDAIAGTDAYYKQNKAKK